MDAYNITYHEIAWHKMGLKSGFSTFSITYHIILYHIISYDIISYHKISYHIIRYDMLWWYMICNDDIWSIFFKFYFFFKVVRPCWGCVWVSSLVILRPSKNWKFLKFLLFSKVAYWPLGYVLASSLIIFSPEINIFEK